MKLFKPPTLGSFGNFTGDITAMLLLYPSFLSCAVTFWHLIGCVVTWVAHCVHDSPIFGMADECKAGLDGIGGLWAAANRLKLTKQVNIMI